MRLRADFQSGSLSGSLTDVATSMSSTALAGLPAVAAPDYLVVVLDPVAGAGDPEIVYVTAHTGGALTATIARGQEGTLARAHTPATAWRHVPTATDWDLLVGDVHIGGVYSDLQDSIDDLTDADGGLLRLSGADGFSRSAPLDLSDKDNLIIEGILGANSRGVPTLDYTGTGDADSNFLQAYSLHGFRLRDARITYSDDGFLGSLIDFDHSAAASDSTYISLERLALWGDPVGPTQSAKALVRLNKAHSAAIRDTTFGYADIGVLGSDPGYSNVVLIERSAFNNMTTAAIKNPGQVWKILNNTFEQRDDLSPGAILREAPHDAAFAYGLSIDTNWMGDAGAGTGEKWVDIDRALGIGLLTNFFSAGGTETVAARIGASQGVFVAGNRFETFNGLDFDDAVTYGVAVLGNDFTTADAPIIGDSNLVTYCYLGNRGVDNIIGGGLRVKGAIAQGAAGSGGVSFGRISSIPDDTGDVYFGWGESGLGGGSGDFIVGAHPNTVGSGGKFYGGQTASDATAQLLLQLRNVLNASETALNVRWLNGASYQQAIVKVGSAGTGPGGSGRALYI